MKQSKQNIKKLTEAVEKLTGKKVKLVEKKIGLTNRGGYSSITVQTNIPNAFLKDLKAIYGEDLTTDIAKEIYAEYIIDQTEADIFMFENWLERNKYILDPEQFKIKRRNLNLKDLPEK